MRHAARVDDGQQAIVDALRSIGVKVYISGLPLDLLCAVRNPDGSWRTCLIEVKDADGRLTNAQVKFIAEWPGEVHVVRSPQEAITVCLGKDMT
jgi:hypothetical protein